jgi:UDP-N-acetyl-D-mannosaminuronate dehydrogenase
MAMSKSEKIGIVGLWHLGSVLCAAWSKLGYDVIGYDNDKQRVNDLSKGGVLETVIEEETGVFFMNKK